MIINTTPIETLISTTNNHYIRANKIYWPTFKCKRFLEGARVSLMSCYNLYQFYLVVPVCLCQLHGERGGERGKGRWSKINKDKSTASPTVQRESPYMNTSIVYQYTKQERDTLFCRLTLVL